MFLHIKTQIRHEFWQIIALFFAWKIFLVICTLLAVIFIPLGYTDRFLGGGPNNYAISPGFFGWANFDGEHYISIAIFGYKNLEQAFFPAYPILISILSRPFYQDLFSALTSSIFVGVIISNFFFLLALILLWELVRIDFSKKIALWTMMILLVFPTSFYLGAVYPGAVLLFLVVAAFYFARKEKWWLVGICGAFASATSVFGFLILPALILEAWQQKRSFSKIIGLFLIPLGLLAYIIYQWVTVGDPLSFYHLQTIVGEQHQFGIVLLPQVFYRYIKMLLTVDVTNPIYQTVILEFVTGLVFLYLMFYGYIKKIRKSYLLFALLTFLLPISTGSLSSVPRYILVCFPIFIALAILITQWSKLIRAVFLLLLTIWLAIETMLFVRGYWVA